MATQATWHPHTEYSNLEHADPNDLPQDMFAFPGKRRKVLRDAASVRKALMHFYDVPNVSDADRDLAFANIKAAAAYYGVPISATHWKDLSGYCHTHDHAHHYRS